MAATASRHLLFETARTSAGWTMQQLWVAYLAVGGTGDAFDIEAYLNGLGALSADQQDALANAVNERLDDLSDAARVPYLTVHVRQPCRCQDPLSVLDELIGVNAPDDRDR